MIKVFSFVMIIILKLMAAENVLLNGIVNRIYFFCQSISVINICHHHNYQHRHRHRHIIIIIIITSSTTTTNIHANEGFMLAKTLTQITG